MSAASALARAEAVGVRFRIEEGEVRMSAATFPPADLLAELRRHRAEIHALFHHDAAEAAAMAEHYAAPAGPDLPVRDPLAEGLLRGFRAHRKEARCGQ